MTQEQALPVLQEVLLPHGGKGLDSVTHPNFVDDCVIEYLRQHGRVFSKARLVIHRLANQNCHWNVSDIALIQFEDYRIAHGFALGTDGLWYVHSWGVRSGRILETCPLAEGRTKYFGFELPYGVNPNATHGGLGDELQRLKVASTG